MIPLRRFSSAVFPVLLANALPLPGRAVEPRIAPYLDDRSGALSFTFDDGFRHQVNNAMDIIEPLGIRGTFFLIPHLMSGSEKRANTIDWDEARDLLRRGQELGTHGTIRVKLHDTDEESLDREINGGWRLIAEETGIPPVSYAAPGGTKVTGSVAAKIREHHLFIRNQSFLPNVKIIGYGTAGSRVWDDQRTRALIEDAITKNQWVIPYVHAIVEGYSPFKSKDEFLEHCRWLKSREPDLLDRPDGRRRSLRLRTRRGRIEGHQPVRTRPRV